MSNFTTARSIPFVGKGNLARLLCAAALLASVWWFPQPGFAGDFELGLKAYNSGNFDMAVEFFRDAVRTGENDPNLHYYLADALVKSSRYAEAQVEYQRVLAMAPGTQAARFSMVGIAKLRELEENQHRKLAGNRTTKSVKGNLADRFMGMTYGSEDYMDEITDAGRYIRWSVLDLPLRIWIDTSPEGVRNFQPAFVASMERSLDIWNRALDNKLPYRRVDTPEEAHIRVMWVNTLDTKGHSTEAGTAYHAGITVPQIKDDQLMAMEIKMATFDIKGKPQDEKHVFAVAIHEMGHALGLLGHSKEKTDMMFPQNQLSFDLSNRDKNTIRNLYANLADITSLPPTEEADPEKEKELAERLDAQILKEEAKVKQANASNLEWINLGTTYFQKGKNIRAKAADAKGKEKQAILDESVGWFEKGIGAIKEALKREPNDPLAYYNLCIIHQEYDANAEALAEINMALKFDPQNGKYFREKAWILAKTGNKREALNALDAYLLREPSAAGSPEVERIRKVMNKG